MIISVSAVSAADDASNIGASDDVAVSIDNTDTAVSADVNAKNLTELNTLITGATGDLTLSSDYKQNGTNDPNPITIDKNIKINGNGSTIDANSLGIFVINEGKNVTLMNMFLKNAQNIL